MTEKKCEVKLLKKPAFYSRISYGVITNNGGGCKIVNEDGRGWTITNPIVEDEFYIHNQFKTELKITRTEMAEIFISNARMIMTVNYNKQIKEKDIADGFAEIYPNTGGIILSKANYVKKVKQLTKIALKGEERTMMGRHESKIDDFGRVSFIDMEVERDTSKDYDTRHRLVDPRTLNWLIVGNIKFTIK